MPEEKKYEPASLSIDRKGMLRAHPIFRNLPEDALLHLERIAKTRSIRRGVSIFAKGDPGNALFFVASGTVKISVSSIEGRGAVFNLIKSGEIFGEIALLDGLARTADASSNSDCELVVSNAGISSALWSTNLSSLKILSICCAREFDG